MQHMRTGAVPVVRKKERFSAAQGADKHTAEAVID